MALIHTMSSSITPFGGTRFAGLGSLPVDSGSSRKRRIRGSGGVRVGAGRRIRVSCKSGDDDQRSDGEEPPESLFMKELKKRGLSPGSLSEQSNKNTFEKGLKEKESDTLSGTRSAVSTDSDKRLTNQREVSMALSSEGLEGLIPRAKLLLTLGGTFFFGFGPLIMLTVAFFSAMYLYFGPAFVHDGQGSQIPQLFTPEVRKEEKIASEKHLHNLM
ncbi:hypothetical protein AKJ16_DCAP06265, partial [Drosera capensis]